MTSETEGGYVVSVRAPETILPKTILIDADEVCSQFASEGVRRGAAGINHLPDNELDRFMTVFYTAFTVRT